jgi:hypothetical protein
MAENIPEIIPESPQLGPGGVLFPALVASAGMMTEEEKNKEEKRKRHNAANSKSNRIRGVCKKVMDLVNNQRMDIDGFIVIRDNERKNITIVGSDEFVINFKENKPIVSYQEKKTLTFNLEQLNVTRKPAIIPPSPSHIPKQMASFTPGDKQIYDLQNAALHRGNSPLIDSDDVPASASASGIIGKSKKRVSVAKPTSTAETQMKKRRRRLVMPPSSPTHEDGNHEEVLDMVNASPDDIRDIIEGLPGDAKLTVHITDSDAEEGTFS